MLLEHVKNIFPDAELNTEYSALTEQMNILLDHMNMILEAPMDQMSDRLSGATQGTGQDVPPSQGGAPMQGGPGQITAGDGSMDEIMTAMEQVTKQMEAAKRGMGLINKLGDSPFRTKNRSRMMGHMNRIRGNLRRIEKMLAAVGDEGEGAEAAPAPTMQ